MTEKIIKIPLYHGEIVLKLVNKLSEVNEEFNTNFNLSHQAAVFDNLTEKGILQYVIVFDKTTTNKVIAHECVHLLNRIFIDRNIKLDVVNDEPQAYLMGWLFEQCEIFIKEEE